MEDEIKIIEAKGITLEEVLEYIKQKECVTVSDLVRYFQTTKNTIRNKLK